MVTEYKGERCAEWQDHHRRPAWRRPRSKALATAAVRSVTPSFSRIADT